MGKKRLRLRSLASSVKEPHVHTVHSITVSGIGFYLQTPLSAGLGKRDKTTFLMLIITAEKLGSIKNA